MSDIETAIEYDFFTALWLLSLAVQRDVVVDRPRIPVYLNMYVILVADSGVTRKSTAVSAATKLANMLTVSDPLLTIIEGKTTPEKLDAILQDKSKEAGTARLAISISELAVFLGTERYNATMPVLLTDLYDCPSSRVAGGTLSRGTSAQTNVFVSFLSASTPSWLYQSVNPNIIAGGFTSRCLFVVSEQAKRRIAWPTDGRRDNAPLADELVRLRKEAVGWPKIGITEAALKTFVSWYNRRKLSVDPFNSSFESREDDHILRLGGLLAINDRSYAINSSHIKTAIRLISWCKQSAGKLFEGTTSKTKWILGITKLREHLCAAGIDGIQRSQLYLRCRSHLTNIEYTACLDILHELGAIQRFEVTVGVGRPTEVIRATKILLGKRLVETVVSKLT